MVAAKGEAEVRAAFTASLATERAKVSVSSAVSGRISSFTKAPLKRIAGGAPTVM
jgi:plasmid stability protein